MFYAALAKPALSLIALVAVGVGVVLANNDAPSRYGSPAALDLLVAANGTANQAEVAAADARIAPPKPAAPDNRPATNERSRVEVEFATTDNDEDILVLRGNQQDVTQAQRRMMEMLAQNQPVANASAPRAVFRGDDASVEQLELELKYWELRAKGLAKMAEAKRYGYERMKHLRDMGGAGSEHAKPEEDLAEAILQEADVYQAKAKMVEIKRRIERQKSAPSAPQPATGWNFYQPYPATPGPASLPANRYGSVPPALPSVILPGDEEKVPAAASPSPPELDNSLVERLEALQQENAKLKERLERRDRVDEAAEQEPDAE